MGKMAAERLERGYDSDKPFQVLTVSLMDRFTLLIQKQEIFDSQEPVGRTPHGSIFALL